MLGWFRRQTPMRQRDYDAEQAQADAAYHEQTLNYLKQYDSAKLQRLQRENKRLTIVVGELVQQMTTAGMEIRISRLALDYGEPRAFSSVCDPATDDLILVGKDGQ